jgi:DNA-binding SARP family transcriptional activator
MVKKSLKTHQNRMPVPLLSLNLFGAPQIQLLGQPVRLPYQKAEALLYYLAVSAQPHSRVSLATLFWGNTPEKQARNSLRSALYTIRHNLTPADFLHIERHTIALNFEYVRLDTALFETAVVGAGSVDELTRGLALRRGPLLDGLSLSDAPEFESWLVDQRAKFEAMTVQSLLRLSQMCRQQQHAPKARQALARLLEIDPLHEIGHQQLMSLHLQQGNRAAALQQYDLLLRRLREELGVSPSQATQALHLEILRADGPEADAQISGSSGGSKLQFVGRQRELNLLHQCYRKMIPDGPARLVLLEGEAGIGKTRLAHEWLNTLTRPRVLTTRCFETEQAIPFQPWINLIKSTLAETGLNQLDLSEVWLAELAHLVPDIRQQHPHLLPSAVVDPELTRGRIVQAIYHWLEKLCQPKPVCIFIDDWQWLDQASLTLLRYCLLAMHSRRLPLLILGTRRESEMLAGWPQLKSTLARDGILQQIRLSRLSSAEAAALARTMTLPPQLQTDAFFERLFAETEGNPLFIVELLQALLSDDRRMTEEWPIPATIQSVIQSRLARLNPATIQILAAAAVFGRAFTETLLQQVMADLPASAVLQAIDDGIAANLLAEQADLYDFTHDKIRTVLRDDLTHSRRRHLHQQVAASLEATLSNDFGRLSYHFEMAGDLLRARNYALRAARQAAELYADDEALGWYEKSQTLLGTTPAELSPEAITKVTPFRQSYVSQTRPLDVLGLIHRQRGVIFQRIGRYDEAEAMFRSALSRGQERERLDEQAAAHNLLSFLAYLRSDYDSVGHHARQALDLATRLGEPALQAPGLRHLGIAIYRTGNYEKARQLYDEALVAYRQANDRLGMAGVYNNIGFVLRTQACYAEAIEAFQMALTIYEDTGQIEGVALIYSNVGRTYAFSGDLPRALEELSQGLALSQEAHTDWITVKIHRTLGSVFVQSRQWPQALQHARQARALAEALGSDEDLGATIRLLAEIAAVWPDSRLGNPANLFLQSISILKQVGAQDELERAEYALAGYNTGNKPIF